MASSISRNRHAPVERGPAKMHGIHYTPPELATFLAQHTLAHLPSQGRLTILDPACGDGGLLVAVAQVAGAARLNDLRLVGIDRDPTAVSAAEGRLLTFGRIDYEMRIGDFVAMRRTAAVAQRRLFEDHADGWPAEDTHDAYVEGGYYDSIISNPPYVRTQVLGSRRSRQLAREFDLSGRVDLYQVFVRVMTDHLRAGGVLGLLCSNRFLATEAGAALRALVWREYELCEVFDLGDTKLFGAAVLPAIIIAKKRAHRTDQSCPFTRIYEIRGAASIVNLPAYSSVMQALDSDIEGSARIGEIVYAVERGRLDAPNGPENPWTLSSNSVAAWLRTVESHTRSAMGELTPIRVGIKTTADAVFIRDDWDQLPDDMQPESELLRPLLTHHVAGRWRASEIGCLKRVLYPHRDLSGRRAPVNIQRYPHAQLYLERHRAQLEGREYVRKSGRQWYEIWVPQQPSDWKKVKVVFPDISETPRFFLDTTGAIVNGDCYWIVVDETFGLDDAYLFLAVANSSFALKYYDTVCGNRLYAGRRRFMTQYVKRFPLPHLSQGELQRVREMVGELVAAPVAPTRRAELEQSLDALVWASFGFAEEARG